MCASRVNDPEWAIGRIKRVVVVWAKIMDCDDSTWKFVVIYGVTLPSPPPHTEFESHPRRYYVISKFEFGAFVRDNYTIIYIYIFSTYISYILCVLEADLGVEPNPNQTLKKKKKSPKTNPYTICNNKFKTSFKT